MVSRYDNLRHRVEKLENMPTPRRRDEKDDNPVLQWLHELSPDERDRFLDSLMNKSRHLTRKDTQ